MKGPRILTMALWFQSLWSLLKSSSWDNIDSTILGGVRWLKVLAAAADMLLGAQEDTKNLMLVKWGQRRAKLFLGIDLQLSTPFFGLCHPCLVASLSEDSELELAVRYLRGIVLSAEFTCDEAFILYTHPPLFRVKDRKFQCVEYISTLPLPGVTKKRNADGEALETKSYVRWLHVADSTDLAKFLVAASEDYGMERFSTAAEDYDAMEEFMQARFQAIRDRNELAICCRNLDSTGCPLISRTTMNHHWEVFDSKSKSYKTEPCERVRFECIAAHDPLHLFLRIEGKQPGSDAIVISINRFDAVRDGVVDVESGLKLLQTRGIDPHVLYSYLCFETGNLRCSTILNFERTGRTESMDYVFRLLTERITFPRSLALALHVALAIGMIYQNLAGATISLKVVNRPLLSSAWCRYIFEDGDV